MSRFPIVSGPLLLLPLLACAEGASVEASGAHEASEKGLSIQLPTEAVSLFGEIGNDCQDNDGDGKVDEGWPKLRDCSRKSSDVKSGSGGKIIDTEPGGEIIPRPGDNPWDQTLAIGATQDNAVYVIEGVTTGDLARVADVTFQGASGDDVGTGLVASGGSHWLVGAPGSGTVYELSASHAGTYSLARSASASWTGRGDAGATLAAGDVNGDGQADYLVGAPDSDAATLVFGPLSSGSSSVSIPSTRYASGMSSSALVSDLDGDGYAEVILGAAVGDGAVVVHDGRSLAGGRTTAAATWTGGSGAEAGAALALAGDVTGDGVGDIWVGAPGADRGSGAVYLVSGAATGGSLSGAALKLTGIEASSFGASVDGGLDLDGDGHDDLVVGAPDEGDNGGAWVAFGPFEDDANIGAHGIRFVGESRGDALGSAVCLGPDADSDGWLDVTVAASGGGAVYVLDGQAL